MIKPHLNLLLLLLKLYINLTAKTIRNCGWMRLQILISYMWIVGYTPLTGGTQTVIASTHRKNMNTLNEYMYSKYSTIGNDIIKT